MLKEPDPRTKQAFARLRGDSDFGEVLAWLGFNLAHIDARNRVTTDGVTLRIQQGGAQAIAEFIDHAQGKQKAIAAAPSTPASAG